MVTAANVPHAVPKVFRTQSEIEGTRPGTVYWISSRV